MQPIAALATLMHLRCRSHRHIRLHPRRTRSEPAAAICPTVSRRPRVLVPAGIPPDRMPPPLGTGSWSRNSHPDSRIACAKALTRVGFCKNHTSSSSFCLQKSRLAGTCQSRDSMWGLRSLTLHWRTQPGVGISLKRAFGSECRITNHRPRPAGLHDHNRCPCISSPAGTHRNSRDIHHVNRQHWWSPLIVSVQNSDVCRSNCNHIATGGRLIRTDVMERSLPTHIPQHLT